MRHGIVNFLVALAVHSGEMQGWCLDRNDSEHLRQILPDLLWPYRKVRQIHLFWDGGPSHTSGIPWHCSAPIDRSCGSCSLLAHASWLNQAELLLRSFEAHYLKQGSWKSRRELIEHLYDRALEYNRLFAHPIQWSWTRRNLRDWVPEQAPGLC